ncbi:MAG: gliding motility-associated ABC transporter permease subunit GldF [Saprospiraceae bacterium]
MLSIYKKEINSFFSSLIGYIVIGVFLIYLSLMIWVLPDTSIFEYSYATLDQLFDLSPLIFMFLVPAITMRTFAEEKQSGTIELLVTRPLTDLQIILGKFFACVTLLIFALIPTLIYYITIYTLGSPVGNIDSGATWGSYIGLILLGAGFVSMGIFSSSLTRNQIVAFIIAIFLCFVFYWLFDMVSKAPLFVGKIDDIIQMFGIESHYRSISRGVVDSRDVIYFLSVITFFIAATKVSLESRKW